MESRVRKNVMNTIPNPNHNHNHNHNHSLRSLEETKFREEHKFRRSFSADGKTQVKSGYFSIEALLLLVCLAASLLILPLVLPPLPPPPFLLLLLPIGILGLLTMIVFMPSNVRDMTYTYM